MICFLYGVDIVVAHIIRCGHRRWVIIVGVCWASRTVEVTYRSYTLYLPKTATYSRSIYRFDTIQPKNKGVSVLLLFGQFRIKHFPSRPDTNAA